MMRLPLLSAFLAVGIASGAAAQPASVTATCKDGTSFSGNSRSGACSHHGGVKAFGEQTLGGPGQVWVNSRSKVYHCQGDQYYGKTAQGAFMTEMAAKAAGDRPAAGKACS